MRRSETAAYVAWNCDISAGILDEFSRRIPFQGARVWAISAGLEEFLKAVSYSPRQQRLVHEDIQKRLRDGPPTTKATINIRLRRSLDNQFNALFPEWGASTWFVRTFMEQIVAHMVEKDIAMVQLADASIQRMFTPARPSNEELGDNKPAA